MKKKIMLLLSLMGGLLLVIGLCLFQKNRKNASNIDYLEKGIAIMIDEEGNGKYTQFNSSDGSWPKDEYIVDALSSTCDVNEVKGLGWDSKSKAVTLTMNKNDKCTIYFTKKTKDYDYTGSAQEFIAPVDGKYQIELWGASGGAATDVYKGGNGAYTKGTINLKAGEKLYVYVGEKGNSAATSINGTFNGGAGIGIGYVNVMGGTGGGATDIRLDKGNGNWDDFNGLKSRIMVAAGGGGASSRGQGHGDGNGGAGGTLIGIDGVAVNYDLSTNTGHGIGTGGTQTSGGISKFYANSSLQNKVYEKIVSGFGYSGIIQGTDCSTCSSKNNENWVAWSTQTGGGGGYYGGGSTLHGGAGGGSSYISGYQGCVAIKEESTQNSVQPITGCSEETQSVRCSHHYSKKIFTDTNMIAGDSSMPNPSGGTENGHEGNGHAKITLVESTYDGNNTKAIDLSDNHFDGDFRGNVEIKKDGSNGYGLYFDGEGSFVELPTLPATIDWANGFTIEYEAKYEEFNWYSMIFDFSSSETGNRGHNVTLATNLENGQLRPDIELKTYNFKASYDLNKKNKIKIVVTKLNNSYDVIVYKDDEPAETYNYPIANILNIERKYNYLGMSSLIQEQSPGNYFHGYIYWLKITDSKGKTILWYDFTK